MKQSTLEVLGHGTTGSAVSIGISSQILASLSFIDSHAQALGFLATCFFGFVGLVFYYLNLKKANLANKNEKKLDDHIKETKEQFQTVNDGIIDILHLVKIDKE